MLVMFPITQTLPMLDSSTALQIIYCVNLRTRSSVEHCIFACNKNEKLQIKTKRKYAQLIH